ncbi:MAG: exopolysaccharide biosynthesis polyprenyl glycosylphosphotransferase, partial [Oceanospirillales bacterium]
MDNITQLKTHTHTSIYRFIDMLILSSSLIISIKILGNTFSQEYWLLLFAQLAIFSYVGESMQLYRTIRAGQFHLRLMLLLATTTLSFLLLFGLVFLLKISETYSRLGIVLWFITSITGFYSWRLVYRHIKHKRYRNGINLRKIAIVGLTESGLRLRDEINKHPEVGLECIGFFDDRAPDRLESTESLIGNVNDALERAQNNEIDKLYICLPISAEKRIGQIIQSLGDSTVDVLLVPNFLLKNLMQANISSIGKIDTISVFESPLSGMREFYKRTFDIVFSAAALIGLAPVLIGIALAIKLTSPGPILFRQDRYGLDGKRIGVYKFRSMRVMENSDVVIQATKNDSRITPVGGFLRRTSLDELPQFFNVLIGDMSVVGPRPHAVAHNEEYRKCIDYYMLR